jgi:hypothetical protein
MARISFLDSEKQRPRLSRVKSMPRPSTSLDNLLVLYYPEKDAIGPSDVLRLIEELPRRNQIKRLNLLLNSAGGDIYSAYKAINVIRSRCKTLRVFVPVYAKSAATLMTLGSDEIVMGYQSELGPLDAPIEHPIVEGIQLSAMDGINAIDFLFGFCDYVMFDLGLHIRKETQLSRKDSLQLALDFATKYTQPVVAKLDPLVVNMCYRYLQIAEKYASELLLTYMFRNAKNKKELAEEISHKLVYEYPEHGFAICCKEADRLGLNISKADQVQGWDDVWKIHLKLARRGLKMIHFLNRNTLNEILGGRS